MEATATISVADADEYELERDDGKVERWHMDKVSEEVRKADANQSVTAALSTLPMKKIGGTLILLPIAVVLVSALLVEVCGVPGVCGMPGGAYNKTDAATGLSVGNTAPSASLSTVSGDTVSIHSKDTSKTTVIFFMDAQCESCEVESENLQEVKQKYGDDVRIISVDVNPSRDSMSELQQFKQDYGGNWTYAMGDSQLVRDYRVERLDTTYVLNEDGIIVYKDTRVTDTDTLMSVIDKLETNENK